MDAADRGQVAAAATADEGAALVDQTVEGVLVKRVTLALPDHGFVAVQAERGQRAQLPFSRARNFARRVEVFDTHQPVAAVVTRQQPTAERGQQRAGMQIAGRRGRETAAVAAGGGGSMSGQ